MMGLLSLVGSWRLDVGYNGGVNGDMWGRDVCLVCVWVVLFDDSYFKKLKLCFFF